MTHRKLNMPVLWACLAIFSRESRAPLFASETNSEERLRLLEQQNDWLQSQVRRQQELIDSLTHAMSRLQAAGQKQQNELNQVRNDLSDLPQSSDSKSHVSFGNVHISGEGGLALFKTGSEGFSPDWDFRVDEARLFVEAPVWQEVYFYGEVNLATRENTDLNVELGELYLDFEDVSQLWGRDRQLNVRVGRMDIPFGEEYLVRDAIDNPLVSHSLADVWGISPGVELYGSLGGFHYVVAAQNASGSGVQDFENDKSVAGRIGYDPTRWLHLSVSGMRTGDLNAQGNKLSAVWFGGGFFRSLGSPATADFRANLVEGDVKVDWSGGYAAAGGGYARYGDDDPGANNGRDVFYYSLEAVQQLPFKLYAAARFSEMLANDGFPIVGFGSFSDYFYAGLSTKLWRLSLALGYRLSERLVVKTEYSFERGTEAGGDSRNHEDFFGAETAYQF